MDRAILPIVALLLFVLLPLRSSIENPNPNSAYGELEINGFPVGLLPTSVRGYSLNRTSGDFAVDLDGVCQVTLPPDNYLASYSRRITGRLTDRRIADLDGIRVWAFFRWWSLSGIRSNGDDLVFEVGVASAKYASQNFGESPECQGRSPSPKKAAS